LTEIKKTGFWAEKIAAAVAARAKRVKGTDAEIVCASGISPSGNIHLGNLREIITTHIVVETLKSFGYNARHIHSWDDYDRLRKVPLGVPENFVEFIGKPLSEIPDPDGKYPSYADRFIKDFKDSMDRLGISAEYKRQSEAYKSGNYNDRIRLALDRRLEIFDMLAQYQTLQDSHDRTKEERRPDYYPLSVYCEKCGYDFTKIRSSDPATGVVSYSCERCKRDASFALDGQVACKLVWKVDWPMRWQYEGVDFEPGGVDHSSPGSSFAVGSRLVGPVFGGAPPYYVGYSFVGMSGRSKISSSAGGVPTIANALDIFEPAVLRWLYVKRAPNHAFKIDFGKEMIRVYDEWDRFEASVIEGKASDLDKHMHGLCVKTSTATLRRTEKKIPFRFLSSSADITQGNLSVMMRAAKESGFIEDASIDASLLDPRLSCAIAWATKYLPEDERTNIKTAFDGAYYDSMPDEHKAAVKMLVDSLDENWETDALTSRIYGIPKLMMGLGADAEPTPEIAARQREFFIHVYRLICGSDTGPRIPALFHSIGKERVRLLLAP
jgi:lysyl-tRNA synthetase class 1